MTGSRPPKPKRRWYQFSLRSLLVLTLIVAIGMSWLAVRLRQAQNQRKAVIELQKLGATVEYQETEGGLSNALLRNLVGDEALPVVEIDLLGTQVTDAGLVHLKGLSSLNWLDLDGTQLTDAGLIDLKGLSSLERLDLHQTQVTEGGVQELQQALPNCKIELWSAPDR